MLGLSEDGTVVCASTDEALNPLVYQGRENVAAVYCGGSAFFGLREDGTVAACGSNAYGQCGVEGWTDIIAVAASEACTVGIDRQGEIHIAGQNPFSGVNFASLAAEVREAFIGFALYASLPSG